MNNTFNKSKRFSTSKVDVIPGPGSYKPVSMFNGNGFQFVSNMKSSISSSLYWKSNVKKSLNDSKKIFYIAPGPGYYRIPSEFGVYVSKNSPENNRMFIRYNTSKGLRLNKTANASLVNENVN